MSRQYDYRVVALDPGYPDKASASINMLADEGWEPILISGRQIILRRKHQKP